MNFNGISITHPLKVHGYVKKRDESHPAFIRLQANCHPLLRN
ncbi:hypothetical protein CKO_01805 [Citrobacter koseri ATCC BAA-895]|uniref:Uncharacterized protein n=1 Tax=Citrobacter koseri (strain ATCC BAA-895 / CDC 4225-83 / SGSC4696) TaxID=290338 RepID=A8AHH1_CITK8|nr:hypothetical protein CKO_01805 [Citrobacter koseri ATCC BAA-895]